jgi:benzoyl-CoA reductase/2-hydroxyglutaryl-CoA dehydratase subunit BcrC/BadD/HgdB
MKPEELISYKEYLEKQKTKNKKIITFLSHDNIPIELFEAAGFTLLPLIFAGKDELMDAGHSYLPPSTCSYAQSCIGYFSNSPKMYEFLDLADYVLLSNHCVSNICVSEILADNFKRKRLDFYIPYTRNVNAIKYYKIELENLKKKVEHIIKERIPDYKIKESIIKYNNFKKKIAKISEMNIKGSEKLKIFQKALLYGPAIQPEIDKFIKTHKDNNLNSNNHLKMIIFTGCSIFINDYLIDLIEEAGGNIDLFDTWIGRNYYIQTFSDKILKSTDDPIELLVNRFENNVYGDHCIPNSLENKIMFLEKYINNYKKKKNGKKLAIINHIIKFCDHFSLFQSTFKEKLQDKGIYVLNLERDYSRSIRGQLSTRIEAFMEMI